MTSYSCLNCGTERTLRRNTYGKFCSNRCQGEYRLNLRFVEGSLWTNEMRKFVIQKRGSRCEECRITDWNGKPLRFQVDHIDGNKRNNQWNNLKVVCPNCHSQTETWGIGNMSESGKKRLADAQRRGRLNR